MAEFIHFEAEIDDEINISDDDEAIDDNVSEKSFIKDVKINDSRNFYRQFATLKMILIKFYLMFEMKLFRA